MPDIITENSTPRELYEMLVHVVSVSKRGFVAMGKLLRELKTNDNYRKAIGAGVDDWESFLRQPEISLAAGEANRLIQIYEEFVVRLGYDEQTISEVPVKNLHYLLPLVKRLASREDTDELVADATILSQKDFKERIIDKKYENAGAYVKDYEYFIMRKTLNTGTLDRVPSITSEMLMSQYGLPQNEEMS